MKEECDKEYCTCCGEEIEPADRVWRMPPWYVQVTVVVGIAAGMSLFVLAGKVVAYVWEVVF